MTPLTAEQIEWVRQQVVPDQDHSRCYDNDDAMFQAAANGMIRDVNHNFDELIEDANK